MLGPASLHLNATATGSFTNFTPIPELLCGTVHVSRCNTGICHEKHSRLPAVQEPRCLINDEKALCERLQLSVIQHLEKMEH